MSSLVRDAPGKKNVVGTLLYSTLLYSTDLRVSSLNLLLWCDEQRMSNTLSNVCNRKTRIVRAAAYV